MSTTVSLVLSSAQDYAQDGDAKSWREQRFHCDVVISMLMSYTSASTIVCCWDQWQTFNHRFPPMYI